MNKPFPCLVRCAKHDSVYCDSVTHELKRTSLVVHVFHVYLLRFTVKVGLRFEGGTLGIHKGILAVRLSAVFLQ